MTDPKNVNKKEILDRVTPVIEQIALQLGLVLVEVDFVMESGSWHLRIFIFSNDHPISHKDCEDMTKSLNEYLDPLIQIPYYLEVSSPGVERKLKSPKEYEIFKGRKADIKLKQPQDDLKLFTATIIEYTPETGLNVKLSDTDKMINIKTENISSVRLKGDLK
jgi:ribosome maturation factor RimP